MGHSSSVLGVTASVVSDTSLSLDLSQEERGEPNPAASAFSQPSGVN